MKTIEEKMARDARVRAASEKFHAWARRWWGSPEWVEDFRERGGSDSDIVAALEVGWLGQGGFSATVFGQRRLRRFLTEGFAGGYFSNDRTIQQDREVEAGCRDAGMFSAEIAEFLTWRDARKLSDELSFVSQPAVREFVRKWVEAPIDEISSRVEYVRWMMRDPERCDQVVTAKAARRGIWIGGMDDDISAGEPPEVERNRVRIENYRQRRSAMAA